MPSGLTWRSGGMRPALSTSTSRRASRSRMAATAARTDPSDDMSAMTTGKRSSPYRATRASRTSSRRSWFRPTSRTRAPDAASASTVARPRPDVGPVTSAVRPRSASGPGSSQPNRQRLTACPGAEKLPTTDSSRTQSTAVRRSMSRTLHPTAAGPRTSSEPREERQVRNRSRLMTTLREQIITPLALDETFAFVADFANAMHWDPGVATSERLDEGPLRVGARYRLGIRMRGRIAPMEYRVSVLDPRRRVVLLGEGSGVSAVDDIRFEQAGDGHPDRLHGGYPPLRHRPPGSASPRRGLREGRARRPRGHAAGAGRARRTGRRDRPRER